MRQPNLLRDPAMLLFAIAFRWLGWFLLMKAPQWIEQQTDEMLLTPQGSTARATARVIKVNEHVIGGGSSYAMEYCPTVSFSDRQGISHVSQAPCSLNDRPVQGALTNIRYQPATAKVVWTAEYDSSLRATSFMVSLITRIIGAVCLINAVEALKLAESGH